MKKGIITLMILWMISGVAFAQETDKLFDVDAIKNYDLKQLGWQEKNRIEKHDGTIIIKGKFTNYDWKITNDEGRVVSQPLTYKVTIVLPDNTQNNIQKVGLVVADRTMKEADFVQGCVQWGVPVLLHRQDETDWIRLGYNNRSGLVTRSYQAIIENNSGSVTDYVTDNFFWAMTNMNLNAISLLQKVCEKEDRNLKSVVLGGGSKEAMSVWLASSLDDRIIGAAPGGFQYYNLEKNLVQMEENFDWSNNPEMKQFAIWLVETKAGNSWLKLFDVKYLQDKLHPEIFIINGSTSMHYMHDGAHFPLGMENGFLASFDKDQWRYIRKPNKTHELASNELLAIMAVTEFTPLGTTPLPKVDSVSTVKNGSTVVTIRAFYSGEVEEVRLWWNTSSDNGWHELGQSEWQSTVMAINSKAGMAEVDLPIPDDGQQMAYYVEVETVKLKGRPEPIILQDASLVKIKNIEELKSK